MLTVIETGKLVRRPESGPEETVSYQMGRLEESYLPQVMALQEVAYRQVHRADLFEMLPESFMRQHFDRKGFVLGILVNGQVVGFRNVYYPDQTDQEWHLGRDLGYTGADLNRFANLQLVCVHPEYRGNSLALRMNRPAINLVLAEARADHLCATVSPFNYWNVRVLLDTGLRIRQLRPKYNGKLRYVVYMDLRNPMNFRPETAVHVSLSDLDRQRELLDQGFYGVRIDQKPGVDCASPEKALQGFDVTFCLRA
jgi:hypothetical protein